MKKIVCFGDSITSDEITGVGRKIAEFAGLDILANYAHGNATASDWHSGKERLTKLNLNLPVNVWFADNSLSNQVFRFLQMRTKSGESVDLTPYGRCCESFVGTGELFGNEPDFAYIALAINDGREENNGNYTEVFDDCNDVFKKSYSELNRLGIASALVWAVETLKNNCPDLKIFIASPLFTTWEIDPNAFSDNAVILKRKIIKKVCEHCNVNFIDSSYESGFTKEIASIHGDGVHPDNEYRDIIARFLAKKIMA